MAKAKPGTSWGGGKDTLRVTGRRLAHGGHARTVAAVRQFQLEAGGGDAVRVYAGVVEEVPGEVATRTKWTLLDTFTGQTLPYTVLTHRTCDPLCPSLSSRVCFRGARVLGASGRLWS